jgi:competence protein ComEA
MKTIFFILALFSFNAFAAQVNINTDDAKTISKSLNGIGMKKAEAIIAYRNKEGDFKTYKDLTKVKGIGPKIVEKNKHDIVFSTPAKK